MNIELLLTTGIIVLVLFVLNIVFFVALFFMHRRATAVGQWPSTMGKVVMSMIEPSSANDEHTEYPIVRYSYQVGGQVFEGDKLQSGMDVGGAAAHKVVEKYPLGTQVKVFYNPQDPSDAVLERKTSTPWFMWPLLVVFDCALCGVIPLLWWTMR